MTKIIVQEKSRAFLFKNGKFVRMLEPGSHRFWPFADVQVAMHEVGEGRFADGERLSLYLKDAAFERSVAVAEVPDGHVALRYLDGRYRETLPPGRHCFWNIFAVNTFDVVDTSDENRAASLPGHILEAIPEVFCRRLRVEEHQATLLFADGLFVRRLPAGRHFFWRNDKSITWETYDLRSQQLEVTGQEILTADKVALRINFVCTYRIVDPESLHCKVCDYESQLYVALQLTLRELVGQFKFDELLERKNDLPDLLLELLRKFEGRFSVEFLSAGLKDIVLPGEIRDIMNTVLVAEKKAQANVIARREEVASTRSLLNTARMLDENATLYKLKELEYLERICDKVGSISLDSAGNMLEQLGTLLSAR